MPSYVFPGFPSFLASAAAELGLPESVGPARRITVLTDLANLCAQAAHGDPAHVEAILAKAAEFRDQLAIALRAADLMLADVTSSQRAPTMAESVIDLETIFEVPQASRSSRKGTRSERISS